MSHVVTKRVRGQRNLSLSARGFLLTLADMCDPQGVCFPRPQTLATEFDMSKRRVQEHLSEHEGAGRIITVDGPDGETYLLTCGMTEAEIAAVLSGHSRFLCSEEDAIFRAKRCVERVRNPAPLNRQEEMRKVAPLDAESRTPGVRNVAPNGAESRTPYKDEPSINRQLEPPTKEPPSSAEPEMPSAKKVNGEPDFVAFQHLIRRYYGMMSKFEDMRILEWMEKLRLETDPVPTAENIPIFGERWKALGRDTPTPQQVFTHWLKIMSVTPAKFGGEADEKRRRRAERFGQRI